MDNLIESLKKDGLSSRQAEVTSMVCTGLKNREIGDKLCICERTVKSHLENIFMKLNVKSRMQLAIYCFRIIQS